MFFLALDAWLIAFYVLSEHRVAVVDGHSVTNSSALLSQALTAVDRAYGGDIAALETASSDGSDPDECFFLRDAKGTFEPMMTCGGALLDHGCAGCGGEVDFILAVPFRVVQSKGGYVGEISDRPVAVEGSRVLSGDRLWRPDGETGTITNLGGGTLETDFGGFQNSGVIAGGAAVPVAFGALTVGALLATSRSRASKPASPQPARPSHTWDSLARTAFAPPVTPPSPVLVVPTAPPPAPDRQPALVGQLLAPEPANEPEQTSPPVLHGELREQAVRTTRVNVIGHIQVDGWAEQPTRAKTTELAVYLALHADRPVAAERLRTVIWAYDPSRGDVS